MRSKIHCRVSLQVKRSSSLLRKTKKQTNKQTNKPTNQPTNSPNKTQSRQDEYNFEGIRFSGFGGSSSSCKNLEDVWLNQLMMIPQISEKLARSIVSKYPNSRSLLDQYYYSPSLSETQKEGLLSQLPLIGSEASKRIGQAASSRVYQFFK